MSKEIKDTTCGFCGADNPKGWTECRECGRDPDTAKKDTNSYFEKHGRRDLMQNSFSRSEQRREAARKYKESMIDDCENARPFGVSDRVKYRDRVGVVEHVIKKSQGMQLSLRFEDGNTSLVDANFVELINKSDLVEAA